METKNIDCRRYGALQKPQAPGRWQAGALVLVVLLHLALLALFSQPGTAWWQRPAATSDASEASDAAAPAGPARLTWLTLLPPPDSGPAQQPVPEALRDTVLRPRPQSQARPAATQAPVQAPVKPPVQAPIKAPAQTAIEFLSARPPATAAAVPEWPAAITVVPDAAPSAPPLRLTLPRNALPQPVNPALADLRDPAVRRSLESRLQAALGAADGPVTEERLSDGSVVFRRGGQCVIARPARAATLDPFNQSVSPIPRTIDSC